MKTYRYTKNEASKELVGAWCDRCGHFGPVLSREPFPPSYGEAIYCTNCGKWAQFDEDSEQKISVSV
jgi:hypothetical protein